MDMEVILAHDAGRHVRMIIHVGYHYMPVDGHLCDSPTEYCQHPDVLDLSKVPAVWIDLATYKRLECRRYIMTAKQKAYTGWYGGCVKPTNWDARSTGRSQLPEDNIS